MGKTIGVDIGGTFTDIVVLDQVRGELSIGKFPSTSEDPSLGLIRGLDEMDASLGDVRTIVHGTTVATNAILERKGGICGLIATAGFRDILELRRRDRPHLYGLTGSYEPLIPRERRYEVQERTDARGNVLIPLAEDEILKACRSLLEAGVEAVVISFLNAYVNPENERRAREVLKTIWPNEYIVLSSDIWPVIREFERTSTAVANAYVQPRVAHYLRSLEGRLRTKGYAGEVLIMQSNGGVMSLEVSKQRSVNTVLSGPAAGVVAAARIAGEAGHRNLISYDMGGTSLDVSLIVAGVPTISDGAELEFGIPIMVSMVDINTIGAGGGSMARIDRGGVLQIGPDSAGADPGPVCYGRGGGEPTVTDANLVLGRINPIHPIAGRERFVFDLDGARRAIGEKIGRPMGLSVEEAAHAIVEIANNKISGSIRRISIDRGYDPRDFALFPFGGAGPLHACFLIRQLGAAKAIVPYYPGVTSAIGCVISDVRHDFVRVVNQKLDDLGIDEVREILTEQRAMGEQLLREEDIPVREVLVIQEANLSYERQTHVIRTPLPLRLTKQGIARAFRRAYLRQYGRVENAFSGLEKLLEKIPIQLTSLHTAVIGVRPELVLRDLIPRPGGSLEESQRETRPVYFDGRFLDCPVYTRPKIPWKVRFAGPALIEQPDTTVWVEPGAEVFVDEGGNLIIK